MDMVTNVTSLGRSGLYDWMIQRATAIILAAYVVFIVGFFIVTPDVTYETWKGFFQSSCVRIFSLLALISMLAHAWIGMWTVSTDYLKATGVRFVFQALCGTGAFVYLVWGIEIIWGV